MKLPAASCGVSKRNSPKPIRHWKLSQNGGPTLLRSNELRRVALPFIPIASYRIFWRRRIKCFFERSIERSQIISPHFSNDPPEVKKRLTGTLSILIEASVFGFAEFLLNYVIILTFLALSYKNARSSHPFRRRSRAWDLQRLKRKCFSNKIKQLHPLFKAFSRGH